jgi:hypothetical protein
LGITHVFEEEFFGSVLLIIVILVSLEDVSLSGTLEDVSLSGTSAVIPKEVITVILIINKIIII